MSGTTLLNSRLLPVGIILAGLIGMTVMIKARPAVTAEQKAIHPPTVNVVRAVLVPATARIIAYGEVVPVVRTSLTSEVAGTVIRVAPSFVSGGAFRKGELLYSLDPTDYDLAVVSARARFEKARIAFESEEAESAIDAAERKALGTPGETPLATRERQRALAAAELAAAEADMARAQRDREAVDRRAPFHGRVERSDIGLGQYVGKGNVTGIIYSAEALEIRLPVPDEAFGRIGLPLDFMASKTEPGPAALFSATFAGEERIWKGRSVRVEGSVDPKSRMVTLVGRVEDPYGLLSGEKPAMPLTPGMFVTATIEGKQVADVLTLPSTALREGNRLALVNEQGALSLVAATLLWRESDNVAVTAPVPAGAFIVTSPLDRLVEGMTVKPAEAEVP